MNPRSNSRFSLVANSLLKPRLNAVWNSASDHHSSLQDAGDEVPAGLGLLEHVVSVALATYVGGERFFDAVDATLRDRLFVELLIAWSGERLRNVVVSGRFGRAFSLHCRERTENLILVRGNLRDEEQITSLDALSDQIRGRGFVFFDDSLYSGTTRQKIEREIERLGGWLDRTYVLYDGSLRRDSSVFGIYRYHAHDRPSCPSVMPQTGAPSATRSVLMMFG
jgi:hypothetical protein